MDFMSLDVIVFVGKNNLSQTPPGNCQSQNQLFADEAILAIHQGSGGLLRRANNLARGALIAAAKEQGKVVSVEHVRVASTEII